MDHTLPRRRRYPRIPAEHAVLVQPVGEEHLEKLARTRNVSLGGCRFTSADAPPRGALVQLLITVRHQVVDCLARVVYRTSLAPGGHDVGVEFVYMSESGRDQIAALFAGAADVPE
jgi:c-di-GMP-binding flagellar brake protein YcgR